MIRTTIGLILLLAGVVLKAALNHNIDYWGSLKTWTIIIFIIGLIVLSVPLLQWAERPKGGTFLTNPGRVILRGVKVLIVLIALVFVGIQLENFGIWANRKLVNYYLSTDTATTKGIILGEVDVSYWTKTRHVETFYEVVYRVNGEVIRQGVEPSYSLNIGQTYLIKYSRKHPSMFQILHRTTPET